MSLQIHRAERADRLVGALGALLTTPLSDPFVAEVVSVPTPGVERWLAQELAGQLGTGAGHRDGVCATIDFPSPRRLVVRALAAGSGPAADPDPWHPKHAVWPLLRVIDAARGQPWAALLWSHLEPDPVSGGRQGRRWSTARRLADLFARYAAIRPSMIAAWHQGHDVDADGSPLPPDRVWQAELWRRLRSELGTPGPVEQVEAALTRLPELGAEVDLPPRVSVFGVTRFDPHHLRVLAALAAQRDVHLWLPHPSAVLWRSVATALAERPAPRRRAADWSEAQVEHRLLAYLGRDSRELQLVLAGVLGDTAYADHHHAAEPATPTTVLERLQSNLAGNRPPAPAADRPLLGADDRSIALHAAHGPDRQVEVLRELLVGLLADDPTLEPRDIVVMCPDIETFAPLIAASFGLEEAGAEHPGHRLRVRLADRALRQVNPLLEIIAQLVELAGSRMEASRLLDLCAAPPVARKFGFRAEHLERLHELVSGAGVRWGLNPGQRADFGMGDFAQNTWAAGLDRMLLGVAMDETEQHFIGTTLPLDDVDSGDVDLVGRLAECISRVRALTEAFEQARPIGDWVELFRSALAGLTAVPPADRWQLSQAYAELARLAAEAEVAPPGAADSRLGRAEIALLLADRLRGRPTRANFRTGTLTMCTMLPMRSVPHRVVCLLGLDDGVFPRPVRPDGDDICLDQPWVGDRDPRSEDRQLLLDAVLSARERLIVVYAGMDPRTGQDRPPAVPIGELLDALDVTVRTADASPARRQLTVRHPLQPFDERNFVVAEEQQPFSFDVAGLRGARAGRRAEGGAGTPAGGAVQSAAGAAGPFPPVTDWSPQLADLLRFLVHPCRALLRERAGLTSWRADDDPDEQIPVGLEGLDRWRIGERMLRHHLHGDSVPALVAAEWRRGEVPPRQFGQRVLEGLTQSVTDLADLARPFMVGDPLRYDLVIPVGSDRLTGTVAQVFGTDILRVGFSQLSARTRLQSWVELLALTAAHPDRDWRAVTVGRGGCSVLGPVPGVWATRILADLVDLQRTGLREPLPFAPRTSAEYAAVRGRGRPLEPYLKTLEKLWAQDRDEAYEQFFGPGVRLATMLEQPSRRDEERGDLAEPSRFGTLARRVFHPLLSSEELR